MRVFGGLSGEWRWLPDGVKAGRGGPATRQQQTPHRRGSHGLSALCRPPHTLRVLAEDKLFATLDPTTRRVELGQGQEVLLTDTVGEWGWVCSGVG